MSDEEKARTRQQALDIWVQFAAAAIAAGRSPTDAGKIATTMTGKAAAQMRDLLDADGIG